MYYSYFQAGFIVLLFNEFRSTIITGVGYFLLTLFVQVWTLTNRFKGQVYFYWPDGLYIFFVLHKFSKWFLKRSQTVLIVQKQTNSKIIFKKNLAFRTKIIKYLKKKTYICIIYSEIKVYQLFRKAY